MPQNVPGDGPGMQVTDTVPIEARVVVHLHGGRTQADSDGWPDNTFAHGHANVSRYENDQQATLLWYHDHAMGITRYNVYAGLAGLWIIRDHEELDHLAHGGLPDERHELILAIQDRNLATTDGTPTGPPSHQFLHKISDGTREFFGPFTLVNGTVWPFRTVSAPGLPGPAPEYSNARTYGLELRYVNGHDRPTSEPVPAGTIARSAPTAGCSPRRSTCPRPAAGSAPFCDDAGRACRPRDRLRPARGSESRRRLPARLVQRRPRPLRGRLPRPRGPGRRHQQRRLPEVSPGGAVQRPPAPAFGMAPSLAALAPVRATRAGRRCRPPRPADRLAGTRHAGGGHDAAYCELFAASDLKAGCHATEGGPIPVEVNAYGKPRTYRLPCPASPRPAPTSSPPRISTTRSTGW